MADLVSVQDQSGRIWVICALCHHGVLHICIGWGCSLGSLLSNSFPVSEKTWSINKFPKVSCFLHLLLEYFIQGLMMLEGLGETFYGVEE